MSRTIYLSKSKLISGWQCGKRLWLEKYTPELAEISAATESAFSAGHLVGDIARTLFPGGILIGHDQELGRALQATQGVMAQSGPRTIYEGTFQADGVLVRADILVKDSTGSVRLVEVKASTKVKEYHLYDCAIQYWVLEKSGLNVDKLELAHVNNRFVYRGDGDYQGLLTYVDVLEPTMSLLPEIDSLIEEMRGVLAAGEPVIAVGEQCTSPFECPFYNYCLGPQPDMPVSWLPGGRSSANKLISAGYRDIREVPEGYLTNEVAEQCRQIAISGEPFLDARAADELGKLEWPRYYLDFETLGPAVPVFADTSPYQAQAFQWSCHIEHQDGDIEHQEFLADGDEPPMRPCAESLIDALGDHGPVLMYTSYERTIINGFIAMFPDLEISLRSIVSRLFDLHPIAKKYFYHPDMHGSWSIKAILPAVAPELNYDALENVSSGAMAEPAFLEMIDETTEPGRTAELRSALLRYCELDTLAMVRLAHYLEGRRDK